jgi:hypothetical protein
VMAITFPRIRRIPANAHWPDIHQVAGTGTCSRGHLLGFTGGVGCGRRLAGYAGSSWTVCMGAIGWADTCCGGQMSPYGSRRPAASSGTKRTSRRRMVSTSREVPLVGRPYPRLMVVDLPSVAPRPRPVVLRLVYTVLILAVLVGLPWLVGKAGPRFGARVPAWWPSPPLILVVLGALVASRVSYRWRDGLLLLIPIVGLFYLGRFAWRLSFLPYRDWPPRRQEAPYWRKVSHPARPGAGLYLVDRPVRRQRRPGQ